MILRSLTLAGAALALAPAPGASLFTGTWVADLDTQSGLTKDVYFVANGVYTCMSCSPPRHYPADGKLHTIVGDPFIRSESVTITGPRTIVTRLIETAMTRTTTMTASPDGQSATYVSSDHRPGISQPLRTVYLARRVTPPPNGAHLVSGTWQGVAYKEVPELIRTTELRDDGRTFTYRVPIGATYTAVIGGGFAPLHGAGTEGQQAMVKQVDARTIVETRKREGKVTMVRTYSVSSDGKALTIASRYPATNSTFRIVAHRKSRSL